MHFDAPLDCGGRPLDLSRPRVMGILNVTPDSFSDGGRFLDLSTAMAQARQIAGEGVAIFDVGGESTRPGSAPVSEQQELDRVIPVIEALYREFPLPISIDTSKPSVMRAAVAAGAGMINDVYGLRAQGALEAAAACRVPVCLMHMQGEPRTMQQAPDYGDVVAEVETFLRERMVACELGGIPRERQLLDPGFGFGKTLAHNLTLFGGLSRLAKLGPPLLVGFSRKSMIGGILGNRPVEERLHGSVAAALLAAERGARLLRVHDVGPTADALRVLGALQESCGPGR